MSELVPESWMPAVEKAMKQLHNRFNKNTNLILTESDLKCWLFYELQDEKNKTFSVHSEVTHFAEHFYKDEIVVRKHQFRDLSMLSTKSIDDNVEFLKKGGKQKDVLRKGFKHKAPAVHFELKFIRQRNNLTALKIDILKLNEYYHNNKVAERKFIVVWGSKCTINNIDLLMEEFTKSIKKLTNQNIKPLVEFYLFDVAKLIHLKWNEKTDKFEIT